MVTPADDRGQIMLVGAIAIAIMILGVGVLLNAAVTTEVRAPDDPATDLDEADRLAGELEAGIAGLAARANQDGRYAVQTDVADAFDANLSVLMNYSYLSVGQHRATLFDGSSSPGNLEYGRFVADGDRNSTLALNDDTGAGISVRVSDENATAIHGLSLSLEVDSLDNAQEPFGVRVNGSADCALFRVEETGGEVNLSEYAMSCNSTDIGDRDPVREVACDPGNATYLRIDLGRVPSGAHDCHVDAFASVEPFEGSGYGLAFRNPDSASGGYRYLLGSTNLERQDQYADEPGDEPYAVPVLWSFELGFQQEARASTRSITTGIDVYRYPGTIYAMEVPWG